MIFKQQIKRILIFILLFVLTCSVMFASANIVFSNAESAVSSLTVEDYTATDEFLNCNGTEIITIKEFAQTVISSNDTMNLSDLTKVISVEYLRTTDEEKYYAYGGLNKE